MKMPRTRISITPGIFKGLGVKNTPKTKSEMKPLPAPKILANALGVQTGMPIHYEMAKRLINHPDADVAAAAKRLMQKY